MLYLYLITAASCSQDTQENRRTYGIAVFQGFRKVAHVHDVSTKFLFVFRLCVKFTTLQLSPLHLTNVLEDVLSEPH